MLLTMPSYSNIFYNNHYTSYYSENNLCGNISEFDPYLSMPCSSTYIDSSDTNHFSQSLPNKLYKPENKNTLISKKKEISNKCTQTETHSKFSFNNIHSINILYSDETQQIAKNLLNLCDQFDMEFYNNPKSLKTHNHNSDSNFLLFCIKTITYCITDFLN